MNETVIDIVGWTGAFLLLLAYGLVSWRRLEGNSIYYQFLNATGGMLLIVNSYYYKAFPSVAVNCVWISIAFFTIFRKNKKVF